jgi:hypothetical protein
MTEDEYRDELRRLIELNRPAKAEVSLYVTRVLRGEHFAVEDDEVFQDAVNRVEETWPKIIALLREAPHGTPTRQGVR